MQQNYPSTSPFSQCTDALVRDTKDIRDLADIEVLLRSYPHAAVDDLAALREHRNKVAHGGRVGKESRFGDPVKVHRTLVDLISIARSR